MGELGTLWRFRDVVHVLIARELKARYRGAALGFLWSFVNPLLFMAVYVLVFSVYLRIDVEHYAAFLLCGMLPWTWFSASLNESSRSILEYRALVKKVALPAEIFPLVSIGSGLVHYLLSLPVLVALLFAFGINLGWPVLLLPVVVAVQFAFTFGIALICSSLAVRFRDLLQIVPNLLTIWFFVTPVFYPASMVPAPFRGLLLVNPMAPIIAAYQDILFHRRLPEPAALGLVAVLAVLLVVGGQAVFDAHRESFAEEI